jgi:hypothetical protein
MQGPNMDIIVFVNYQNWHDIWLMLPGKWRCHSHGIEVVHYTCYRGRAFGLGAPT